MKMMIAMLATMLLSGCEYFAKTERQTVEVQCAYGVVVPNNEAGIAKHKGYVAKSIAECVDMRYDSVVAKETSK